MKRGHSIIILATVVMAAVACLLLTIIPSQRDGEKRGRGGELLTREPNGTGRGLKAAEGSLTATGRVSNLEFHTMRVPLPVPSDASWDAPFFNSANYDSDEHVQAALEALPVWIRKAVHEEDREKAKAYLGSLLHLLGHKDAAVRATAALSLYRLGDVNDRGLEVMKALLSQDSAPAVSDPLALSRNAVDARKAVLIHLEFYRDSRLLADIESIWRRQLAEGKEEPATVDLAAFLETQGRELPADYWLSRLNTPGNFKVTLEILERRRPENLVARLTEFFEQTSSKGFPPIVHSQAPMAAALLLQLTGEQRYENYLRQELQNQMNEGGTESWMPKAFEAMLKAGTAEAKEFAVHAVNSEVASIRSSALRAMGESGNPEFVSIIVNEARQQIEQECFPVKALEALLLQHSGEGTAQYEILKNEMLQGAFGRTISDFDTLEFLRKYGRIRAGR